MHDTIPRLPGRFAYLAPGRKLTLDFYSNLCYNKEKTKGIKICLILQWHFLKPTRLNWGPMDRVEFEHNYCEYTLVDVVVTDFYTRKQYVFECFDTRLGIFPY